MRNITKYSIWSLAFSASLLASCGDFFEVKPYGSVVETEFNRNQEDLNAAAFAMYEPLSKDVHKFLLWGDARADMVTAGQKEPDPYINEFVINNVSEQNPYTDYSNIYKTIARANRQMEKVYDVLAIDNKLEDRDAKAYYAEALLLRAICYYYLIRTFDEFPIILSDYAENVSFTDEKGETINRSTAALTASEIRGLLKYPESKQEVWLMIYNDVLTVMGLLPLNYEWNRSSLPANERYGRVSQPLAATFAAEVAIWLGEYQTASAFANSPISNNNHSLGTSGAWPNQFTASYATQHSLFLLGYRYDNSFETNRLQEFTSHRRQDGGRYHLKPVSHVINQIFTYENSDIRTSFSFKNFGQDTVIWKYIGLDNSTSMRKGYQGNASWHIYRSADAYLLKALSDLLLDNYSSAFNFINNVRTARGLPLLLADQIDYTNKELMMEMIFRERAREFAFEGKRWYDLMLYSKLSGENKLAKAVASKYNGDAREQIEQKLHTESNWYLSVDPTLWSSVN